MSKPSVRYRVRIKTDLGEIRVMGLRRQPVANESLTEGIAKIRHIVLLQQNMRHVSQDANGHPVEGKSYMPAGEILSIEVVSDSEPDVKIPVRVSQSGQTEITTSKAMVEAWSR